MDLDEEVYKEGDKEVDEEMDEEVDESKVPSEGRRAKMLRFLWVEMPKVE